MQEDVTAATEPHRFQPYVDELREFLASRGVKTGKAEDLAPFAAQLESGGALEEELGSILRAIVYRESETLGRGELLEMLVEAVAGAGIDGMAPGVQANVRLVFLALGRALRQQRPGMGESHPSPDQISARGGSGVGVPRDPAMASPGEGQIQASALPDSDPRSGALTVESQSTSSQAEKPGDEPAPPMDAPLENAGGQAASVPGPEALARPEKPRFAETQKHLASALASLADQEAASPLPPPPLPQAAPAPLPTTDAPAPPKRPHPFSPWVPAETETGLPVVSGPSATARPSPKEEAPLRQRTPAQEVPIAPRRRLNTLQDDTPAKSRRWLVPVIAGMLALLGVLFYFGRSWWARRSPAAASGMAAAAPAGSAGTCSAPASPRASRSGLDERSRWAHNLLDQKLYEAALPELREIAQMDPGFPGIRLDESDALLHLKRPEEARAAVDAQITLSQCLSRLPGPEQRAYCALHYPSRTLSGCQAEMDRIRQQAELQAAMVHLELGHRVQPGSEPSAPAARAKGTRRPTVDAIHPRTGPPGTLE